MDDRIAVSFCACEINGSMKVAPLLLITFIENAFKYVGFNECKENRIDIKLSYEDDSLVFSIFNTKDTFINHSEMASGLGIANAKRRLELLYPDRHQLIINNQENSYEITLTLQDV
jgi:LytS/YehU family sensor histidine kinase